MRWPAALSDYYLPALQVQASEGAAVAARGVLASAADRESDLLQQRSMLEQEQQVAKRREEQLVNKVCALWQLLDDDV